MSNSNELQEHFRTVYKALKKLDKKFNLLEECCRQINLAFPDSEEQASEHRRSSYLENMSDLDEDKIRLLHKNLDILAKIGQTVLVKTYDTAAEQEQLIEYYGLVFDAIMKIQGKSPTLRCMEQESMFLFDYMITQNNTGFETILQYMQKYDEQPQKLTSKFAIHFGVDLARPMLSLFVSVLPVMQKKKVNKLDARIMFQNWNIITRLLYTRELNANKPRLASAARNAPCPCGSGRKYKQCCMNN